MSRRHPMPLELRVGPFATRDADSLGVARDRLRASDVHHPFHGVNTTREPQTLTERAEALAPVMRPADGFSHSTAALLQGIPLPRKLETDSRVHVTSIDPALRMRRPGVMGHHSKSVTFVTHRGLRLVAPAHVFSQLASMLSLDDLVAVGDFLVTPPRRGTRRQPPLCTAEELGAAIPHGARGAIRAHRALKEVRIGAESRMETLLRLVLVRAGLPEPQLNPGVPIGTDTLHPDLLFPQWRVVLEYEGDGHRTDPNAWRRDIWRREAFLEAGYRVVQVHRDDVLKEPEALLARVARAFAQSR